MKEYGRERVGGNGLGGGGELEGEACWGWCGGGGRG